MSKGYSRTRATLTGATEIERDKKAAQGQLSQLTAADAAYKEATTALEQLRRDNDETFTTSIDLVLKLLRNVTTDAEAIKDWLLTAGDDEVRYHVFRCHEPG